LYVGADAEQTESLASVYDTTYTRFPR
jgi:hypothetical protein